MSASTAVAWARDQIGVHEVPSGSNKGPKITQWEIASGYPSAGVPWCQCFANAVAHTGGAPLIKDGFTPNFLRGDYAEQGYIPIPVGQAEPGDFIYYKWPGVSDFICDHVGVLTGLTAQQVKDIEGNTSSGDAGSQNNGGMVADRTRSRALVAGAVSVPYPERVKPHRTLKLGMSGLDVREFQEAINERASGCKRPDRRVEVDGSYGSETKENGAWAAFLLGIGDSQAEIKSGGISAMVQGWVRDPDSRNDTQKKRASARRGSICGK